MPRHPKKDIQKAIEYALDNGFRLVEATGSGHLWGVLLCPGGRGACRIRINCTPQNPGNHAKRIRGEVDQCIHR